MQTLKFLGWMALSLALSTAMAALLVIPLMWSVLVAIGSYRRDPTTLITTVPCVMALELAAIYWAIRVERLRQKIHTMVRRVYLNEGGE